MHAGLEMRTELLLTPKTLSNRIQNDGSTIIIFSITLETHNLERAEPSNF
jgi:hypothetical protein